MSVARTKGARRPTLAERLLRGEPLAIARAITAVENETPAGRAILREIQPHLGRALVVGFTGPPGAGKSTLVNGFIGEMRRRGKTVGVIAVDPSSPFTGGAVLGDRIRMADWGDDPDVFVRSLASRGHLGGLSPTAARIIDVMDAAGKTVVIVETVGAGQSEVEIAEVADVKIVVCAPGLGDEVQAIKAGILEIADILVVNKADQPLADHTKRLLEGMLKLRKPESRKVPVLATTATDNTGVDALAEAVLARGASMNGTPHERDPLNRVRVLLAEAAAELVKRDVVAADDPLAERLCRRVQRGDLDLESAARQLLSGGIDA